METHNSHLKIGNRVKLLCSYGGKIRSRPKDCRLSYAGGDTKILAVDRNVKFSEITARLNSICNRIDGSDVSVKYQLPGEDLDALVSLIDDEDVEHMMVEYDRMQRISTKPVRLRLFIFDISGPPVAKESIPVTPSNPDYLFGFDKEYQPSIRPPLDLLQIPGIALPENCRRGGTGSQVNSRDNNVSMNGIAVTAAEQAVYRVPVVMNGGVNRTGSYAYGIVPAMGNGNQERVLVPVLQSEQGMTQQGAIWR